MNPNFSPQGAPQQVSAQPHDLEKNNGALEVGTQIPFSVLDTMRPLPDEEYRKRLFEWLTSSIDLMEMETRIDEKAKKELRKIFIETVQTYDYVHCIYSPNEMIVSALYYRYFDAKQRDKMTRYRGYMLDIKRLGTNLRREIDDLAMTDEDLAFAEILDTVGMYDASIRP
jgi:hypothetical protein